MPNGVLLFLDVPQRYAAEMPPEELDAVFPQLRAERERLAAALADLERLRSGWVPGEADLAGAPVLGGWQTAAQESEPMPFLVGTLRSGHPHIPAGKVIATSSLVALDAKTHLWARTISRFYRLGRPLDAELSS